MRGSRAVSRLSLEALWRAWRSGPTAASGFGVPSNRPATVRRSWGSSCPNWDRRRGSASWPFRRNNP